MLFIVFEFFGCDWFEIVISLGSFLMFFFIVVGLLKNCNKLFRPILFI